MLDKPTEELEEALLNTPPGKLNDFFKENEAYMAPSDRGFYNYFKSVIKEKGIMLSEIYRTVSVSEKYGQKIISEEKHTKNRDLIIAFCVSGHFSLIETNRALKLYGISELYSKNKRDACIILEINNRHFDPDMIDDALIKNGFSKLKRNLI